MLFVNYQLLSLSGIFDRGDVSQLIHMNLIPFSLSMSSSYPMKEDQSSTNQELSREPKQYKFYRLIILFLIKFRNEQIVIIRRK